MQTIARWPLPAAGTKKRCCHRARTSAHCNRTHGSESGELPRARVPSLGAAPPTHLGETLFAAVGIGSLAEPVRAAAASCHLNRETGKPARGPFRLILSDNTKQGQAQITTKTTNNLTRNQG